jgi:hypothetical protein
MLASANADAFSPYASRAVRRWTVVKRLFQVRFARQDTLFALPPREIAALRGVAHQSLMKAASTPSFPL